MKNRISFFLTSLALFLVAQSNLRAGIVVTTQAAIVDAATTATVNVSVFARHSGAPNPLELVSTYGLRLTVTGVTPTIPTSPALGAPATAPNTSEWFAFDTKSTSQTANSVLFQGRQNTFSPSAVPISTAGGAATLLGTFSFTVNKTNAVQSFSVTPTADTAINGVFAAPANGSSGTGFLFFSAGFLQQTIPNTTFSGDSGNIGITAVPEPSSFVLLGLVACGYMLHRRRSSKAS